MYQNIAVLRKRGIFPVRKNLRSDYRIKLIVLERERKGDAELFPLICLEFVVPQGAHVELGSNRIICTSLSKCCRDPAGLHVHTRFLFLTLSCTVSNVFANCWDIE